MTPKGFVFFDLDGTLLNEYSEVDKEVAEAIKQLHHNQFIPFIATGRSPIEIQDVAEQTGITSFIALNGQYVQYEGEEIFRSKLDKHLLKELKATAEEESFPVSFYSPSKIRVTKMNETVKKAYQFINEDTPDVDEQFYKKEDILMSLVINDNAEKDHQFIEKFPEFSFYRNTPFSVDVIKKGHSKATGIDALMDKMGATDLPTYAFGDGANDLEMFQKVDVAVAMENGIREVKEAADFVTSSHLNNGIIKGLKEFDLL